MILLTGLCVSFALTECALAEDAAPSAQADVAAQSATTPAQAHDATAPAPAVAPAAQAVPAAQAAVPTPAEQVAKADPVVCRSETATGSLGRRIKICMTKSEWDKQRQAAKGYQRSVNRASSTGVGGESLQPGG